LYVGCPGWQTAPGGGGLSRRPERDRFKDAHSCSLGHEFEFGVALHFGSGLQSSVTVSAATKRRAWRKQETVASFFRSAIVSLAKQSHLELWVDPSNYI
jgi:hypothetical protein